MLDFLNVTMQQIEKEFHGLVSVFLGKQDGRITVRFNQYWDDVDLDLTKCYEMYKEGADVTEFIKGYIDLVSALLFQEREKCKEFFAIRVINSQRNENSLRNMPRRQILDLSVVISVMVRPLEDIVLYKDITYDWLNNRGVSFEELYEIAYNNTHNHLMEPMYAGNKLKIVLDESIASDIPTDKCELGMMYGGLNGGLYGAACLCFTDYLDKIAKKLSTETMYVFPSSTNEILFACDTLELEVASSMILEANQKVIGSNDFLSNNLYHYSSITKQLTFRTHISAYDFLK